MKMNNHLLDDDKTDKVRMMDLYKSTILFDRSGKYNRIQRTIQKQINKEDIMTKIKEKNRTL